MILIVLTFGKYPSDCRPRRQWWLWLYVSLDMHGNRLMRRNQGNSGDSSLRTDACPKGGYGSCEPRKGRKRFSSKRKEQKIGHEIGQLSERDKKKIKGMNPNSKKKNTNGTSVMTNTREPESLKKKKKYIKKVRRGQMNTKAPILGTPFPAYSSSRDLEHRRHKEDEQAASTATPEPYSGLCFEPPASSSSLNNSSNPLVVNLALLKCTVTSQATTTLTRWWSRYA